MLTERQLPYTGPYYSLSHSTGTPHNGKTVEALKRAMSRMGFMPWVDFSQDYGPVLEGAMKKWQATVGITPTGQYGKGSWIAIRSAMTSQHEYALDRIARTLIQDEAKIEATSDAEALVQKYIVEFWTLAISNNAQWHYVDGRPGEVDVFPAGINIRSDCSLGVIEAHKYAAKKSGIAVPDPSKQNYSGYGNTDQFESQWPHVTAPFRVGDLAHFASPRHVIECIKPGDRTTAHWGSNGNEQAPELITNLSTYRANDYLYTVRPALLP